MAEAESSVLAMIEAHEAWLRGGGDTGKRGELLRLNMRDMDLRGASLANANIRECDLTGSDLSGADLRGCSLVSSVMVGVNFTNTLLDFTDMTDTDLRGANFTGASLNGVDMWRANLKGAVIDPITLHTLLDCREPDETSAYFALTKS